MTTTDLPTDTAEPAAEPAAEPVKRCRSGLHELTPDNLTADGSACRACRRKSQRDWARAYRNGGVPPAVDRLTPDPGFDRLDSLADALIRAVHKDDPTGVVDTLRNAPLDQLAVVLAARLRPNRNGRRSGACGTDAGVREHAARGRPLCAACTYWVEHKRDTTVDLVADLRARARDQLVETIVADRRRAKLHRRPA